MERLAELAQYDQAFNGSLFDDDFLAAGFTPDEVSSYRSQTAPQPMMQADRQAFTDQYGTLQQPDYTRRERMAQGSQDFLTNTFGMEPYNAGALSRSILGDPNAQGDALSGMGLTDFTPLGAVFGAEEGAATASRGYDAGDPLQMGLGGLEAGLSIAEAFPIARLAASPLKRAVAEIADEVLNSEAARSIIDSPLAGEIVGNTRAAMVGDIDFLRGRGDPSMSQGVGADVTVADVPLSSDKFLSMAQSGEMQQARTIEKDIADITSKKMPANVLDIRYADEDLQIDYETGELTQRLEDAGLFVEDDKMGIIHAGTTLENIELIKNAQTPYEFGKAYGYSDDDIAKFYLQRRGGQQDLAYDEYINDRKLANIPNALIKSADVTGRAPLTFDEVEAAMAEAPQPDLDTRIPYRRDGAAIADRLQQTPSAKTALGIDDVAPAGMFTTVKAQQPNILREHTSEGFLSDELVPPKLTSIGDYLGRDSMAIVGDNTGRQTVTGQGGRMFETPVDSMAGFQYIDVPGQGYAGARSATSSKYQEALRSNDPFYNSLLMGERSGDFSQHVNDIYGEMFKNSSIDPSDISKIDDSIRKIGLSKIVKVLDDAGNVVKKADGSPKTKSITTYPFEGFSSVKDPKAVGNYLKDLPTGTQRAAFIKGMDKAGLHKMGVPKVADARLAAADPEQIGMDWGTVGYRMFTPDLEKGLMDTTPEMSTTYDTGIDKIGRSETLLGEGSRGIPANLLYRDLAESQRAKGTGGGILMTSPDYKIYEASPKRAKQLIDNLAVETVDTFLELERRFGREQAIKYASDVVSGGKLTSDVIKAARKANAPTWMIGALTTAAGLSSTESEQGEGA